MTAERVLILDFGSQVTQLIARRVREAGVYSEIHPFSMSEEKIRAFAPKAVILSGSPASTTEEGGPRAPEVVYSLGVPVLGICYGQQTTCVQLGGAVSGSDHKEFGRAHIEIVKPSALFDGISEVGPRHPVWMSHGDRVTVLPPSFRVVAASEGAPFAAIADDHHHFYGVQFHPEVVHTPNGRELLSNFVHRICGCAGDWTMKAFRAQEIEKVRAQVGSGRVICGLSGGVDSSVVAALLNEAIGDQLTCVFVDTGFMRAGESEQVVKVFRDRFNIRLVHKDASDLFLAKLAGETDPEKKRKIIGATFIDVFEEEARAIGGADFLAQGTLYPDVIESVSASPAAPA